MPGSRASSGSGCCGGGGGGGGRCVASVFRCCTHCGYPDLRLCCFGCNSTTRVIFIGAGSTLMGFWYFMLLSVILICGGTSYLKHDPTVILILVLGLLYLPMGLILIYSAQARNPLLLRGWAVANGVLAFVDFVLAITFAAHADAPAFCSKLNFNLALAFLELCIKGVWCYCIAVVTQFRYKLLAQKAARQEEIEENEQETVHYLGLFAIRRKRKRECGERAFPFSTTRGLNVLTTHKMAARRAVRNI